jgi:hypothetical protein
MTKEKVQEISDPIINDLGKKAIFWGIWIILLIPMLGLSDIVENTFFIPMLTVQALIHLYALFMFRSTAKTFAKIMLFLVVGTLLFYCLTIGSFIILWNT